MVEQQKQTITTQLGNLQRCFFSRIPSNLPQLVLNDTKHKTYPKMVKKSSSQNDILMARNRLVRPIFC